MVDETQRYSAAEMERMMKVQDVLLKAMARKITWWAAAEILGVTDRTMRRWREKLEKDGYAGLADRRKGKPSAQRIPLATIEKVLGLYKETYYDLNGSRKRCKEPAWWPSGTSGGRTGGGGHDGRCLGCCCTLTAANIAG